MKKTMNKLTAALAFAAVIGLPTAALAQGAAPGEDEKKIDWEKIFGAGGATPPAGGPAEAAPPAPEAAPEPEKKEYDPDREREISRNRRSAIKTYESVLDNQPQELANITKRLESNQALVAKYRAELDKAERQRRYMQVDFLNRTLALKKQRDEGQVSDKLFATLVEKEEDRYAQKVGELEGDAQFARQELRAAQDRVRDLQGKHDFLSASIRLQQRSAARAPGARQAAKKAKPKPLHERLVDDMQGTVKRVSGFQPRYTMDGVNSFDLDVPRVVPIDPDDDDDDEDEDRDD